MNDKIKTLDIGTHIFSITYQEWCVIERYNKLEDFYEIRGV